MNKTLIITYKPSVEKYLGEALDDDIKGKSVIFATPCICTEEIIKYIKDRFELTEENGIQTVIVMPDHSKHYRCHPDC